ncbi:MAG TPA: glycosyltransferase family 39 protein [Roseiflexaceae bacterium]
MASPQETLAYKTALKYQIRWVILGYLAIGLVAFVPRVLNLGGFVMVDEADFWMQRSAAFLKALQLGDPAATAISTHPGVTTMWLGGAGIVLQRALESLNLLHDGSFPIRLALMRLPVALGNSAGILAGYALLRRMLPAATAFLAALLWAADPFAISYGQLLHVDGLAGTFMTLSVLAACLYWFHERRRAWLIFSGACAGLAFLSKSPGLVLVPWVGLVALLAQRSNVRTFERLNVPSRWSSVAPLLAWGTAAALTAFALYPALWVVPVEAFKLLYVGVEMEGNRPHTLGNFFMGREVAEPGPLFYPVALALRTTPLTLLGLLLLPWAWRAAGQSTRSGDPGAASAQTSAAPAQRSLAAITAFVILFVVAMSVFPKKFDRYLVPVFPAIDILAAVGLVGILNFGFWIFDFQRNHSKIENRKSKISLTWVGIITMAALANVAWWHPYAITAFNQLFGGTPAAARTLRIGWGEGLEQTATWLNAQPDITGVATASTLKMPLQDYLRPGAQAFEAGEASLPGNTGYVVIYIRDRQSGLWPPFDQFYGRATPVHTVRLHDVDYAWIYQVAPPVPQARAAAFGAAIRLRGFDLGGAPRPGRRSDLRLFWATRAAPAASYTLFVHLIGPGDRRYVQLDLPYPTGEWGANRYWTTHVPLDLPAGAPAGAYRLVAGLYDPATGQRLPLAAEAAADPALDGPDALLLTQVELK